MKTDDVNNSINRITITNMQGQLVKALEVKTSGEISIDVEQLESGMYFINAYNNNNYRVTRKLVVQ